MKLFILTMNHWEQPRNRKPATGIPYRGSTRAEFYRGEERGLN